ncbi:MAG: 2,3-bisphosphoglycerate-independent phosphoglycerate mutase [bacterium]
MAVKKPIVNQSGQPVILIIMDGWGIAPPNKGNAIALAKTPVIDLLTKNYPHTQLVAHGKKVGLPLKQDGNSETGHEILGAGRLVEQDAVVVSSSIKDGTFFKNAAFLAAVKHVRKNNSKLHLMGLLSGDQSAHVDPNHLTALLLLMRKYKLDKVFIHLFTDGRDSSRFGSPGYLELLQNQLGYNAKIASIQGRFYAMDRKKKWDRLEQAYDLIVSGHGEKAVKAEDAVTKAYNRGETDEFIAPTVIIKDGKPVATVDDHDAIIFFNLRSDRARQITKPFVQKKFKEFRRKKVLNDLIFVTMTDFGPDLDSILTAFPSTDLKGTLTITVDGRKQLYIAESEKYAHVTYFFNGGYANPVAGEERIRILSPDVRAYDQKPEMSAGQITETVLKKINKNDYELMVINFANPDMVGHTGNLKAGIKAVEIVDKCVGEIVKAAGKKNMAVVITSDHGNAEEMINPVTGEVDTKHSTNPVPFILVSDKLKNKKLSPGSLANVAPTILKIMDLPASPEMTSKPLF